MIRIYLSGVLIDCIPAFGHEMAGKSKFNVVAGFEDEVIGRIIVVVVPRFGGRWRGHLLLVL